MGETLYIKPPLKGEWAIYNPPGHPPLAFDFLAVKPDKSPYRNVSFRHHLLHFIDVSETLTWASPVYSPVAGEVVASHDAEPDRHRICFIYDLFRLLFNKPKEADGFGKFGGNHIMIEFDHHWLLLCHLKQGSLLVKQGDRVETGQALAEVGNSGSSIQPHLHIQVMHNSDYFPLFENLSPFGFTSGEVKEATGWRQCREYTLADRAHYRFT